MSNKIQISILGAGLLCLSSAVAAGFFDDLKEKVNGKIDQTREQLKQSVDDITNFEKNNSGDENQALGTNQAETTSENDDANSFRDNINNQANSILNRRLIRDPGLATFSSDIDIIGLRLGMTDQEARTALQGYDSNLQLREKYSQLPQLKDSEYLHVISATSSSGEQIMLEFSAPPRASTVIKIVRQAKYREGAQPVLTRTLQALKQKYGKPSLDKNNNAMTRQLVWLHDRRGNKLAAPSAEIEQRCNAALLPGKSISQQQNNQLENCGEALTIFLQTGNTSRRSVESNGLVGEIVTGLVNVAELVRAEQETRVHIENTINKQANSVAVPRF